MGYQIAGQLSQRNYRPGTDLTRVEMESGFGDAIRDVIAQYRPRKLIETGTYLGMGTTRIVATALSDSCIYDATFISIEANPANYSKAVNNLHREGLNVELMNAVSVPRIMLPTIAKIERQLVHNVIADGLIVDHEEHDRAARYFNETNFPDVSDDGLGRVLRRFGYKPDFVLLDSAGHLGFSEFCYTIDLLDAPCFIALDDVRHVKHFHSLERIKSDARFRIVAESDEKFGFCIAKFDPHASSVRKDVE